MGIRPADWESAYSTSNANAHCNTYGNSNSPSYVYADACAYQQAHSHSNGYTHTRTYKHTHPNSCQHSGISAKRNARTYQRTLCRGDGCEGATDKYTSPRRYLSANDNADFSTESDGRAR